MSQDARPLYFRLLRINHLRPRGPVTFALFEGSIGIAVLLALAEIVSWWGVFAIPASVALMVKLNDIVAGSAMRPLAFADMATARFAAGIITGRSPAPRPSRLTAAIGDDDAVADSAARPDSPPTARGRAASIARGVAVVPAQEQPRRRPSPGVQEPEPPLNSAAVDSAEIGLGDGRLDPTARRTRGNQGRFTS
jgi:hypothetical protein